ncbi:MAG TPA: HAMP domain-containing sensor histidine kinase [Candidatus Gracilibacteria bacterium]
MQSFDPEGDLNLCIPMVAHEMMTSIHITKGYLGLLDESVQTLSRTINEYQSRGNQEFDHLTQLIEKLLHVYRYKAKGVSLKLESVDITQMLREELRPFELKHPEIAFQVDMVSNLKKVLMDPSEMKELFRVLFENGVKYTPNGEHFDIRLDQDAFDTILTFKNTGVGIDDLEAVLRPFARDNYMQAGVGLGFVIAQNVVKLHGGSFSLSSDGSTYVEVQVRIPHVEVE